MVALSYPTLKPPFNIDKPSKIDKIKQMDKNIIKIIEKLKLQIKIIQIQLAILLLKQKLTIPNLDNPKKIIIHHGGGWLDFYGVNEYHRQKWGFRSALSESGEEEI